MAHSRSDVVEQAMRVLDTWGLADLTMRRLAERLEVQAGALYRHVRDKDQLLDLLAEAICAGQPDPDPALPWREQLQILAADQVREQVSVECQDQRDPQVTREAELIDPNGLEPRTVVEVGHEVG